jgi:hypothetical protein
MGLGGDWPASNRLIHSNRASSAHIWRLFTGNRDSCLIDSPQARTNRTTYLARFPLIGSLQDLLSQKNTNYILNTAKVSKPQLSIASLETKIKHKFIQGFSLSVTENRVLALENVINKFSTGNRWQLITDIFYNLSVICLSIHFYVGKTVLWLQWHLHGRTAPVFSLFCFCMFFSGHAVCLAWCSRPPASVSGSSCSWRSGGNVALMTQPRDLN